jgi:hypothetical protein
MDRYAEEVKDEEKELQVAIDECWPVEKIRWIREHTLAITKGRRGGAEIDLQRQNVLLKWIDEQLPIIASECQRSVIGTQATNDCRSASISTNLGKRKRSSDQTCHVKNSRRRVQFTEPSNTKSLPVENADARDLEACAGGGHLHALDISKTVHTKSSPQRTNSSRRDRTRLDPVRRRNEERSVSGGIDHECPPPKACWLLDHATITGRGRAHFSEAERTVRDVACCRKRISPACPFVSSLQDSGTGAC